MFTYDATRMWAIGELAERIARLAIVDEDLVVRACTREMISRWGIPDVLDELRVRLDRLLGQERCKVSG